MAVVLDPRWALSEEQTVQILKEYKRNDAISRQCHMQSKRVSFANESRPRYQQVLYQVDNVAGDAKKSKWQRRVSYEISDYGIFTVRYRTKETDNLLVGKDKIEKLRLPQSNSFIKPFALAPSVHD